MIDIIPIAGMVFSLLMILVIGGFILLFPIARRLGKFLELRIDERVQWEQLPRETFDELVSIVQELQGEMHRLADRQQFVERLLEPGREPKPSSAGHATAGGDGDDGGSE